MDVMKTGSGISDVERYRLVGADDRRADELDREDRVK